MDTTRLTWRFCPSFHDKTYVDFLSYGETITLNGAVVSVCLCVDNTYLERSFLSVCVWTDDKTNMGRSFLSVCVWTDDKTYMERSFLSVEGILVVG